MSGYNPEEAKWQLVEKQIGTRCVLRWIIIQYGRGLVWPGNYLVNSDRTGWDIIANTVIMIVIVIIIATAIIDIIITEIITAIILLKLPCNQSRWGGRLGNQRN